jgi:hypothetical protein
MSALCKDCGMNTEPWPPHRGTQEHYIVKDHVWQQAGMPPGSLTEDLAITGGGGFLCVGCIEKRLGRLLTISDFPSHTHWLLKSCENTPRLLSRVGIAFMAVANEPMSDFIVDRWLASTIKNCLLDHRPRILSVEVDGDEVILEFSKEIVSYRAGPGIMALKAWLRWDREGLPDGVTFDLLPWDDDDEDYETAVAAIMGG